MASLFTQACNYVKSPELITFQRIKKPVQIVSGLLLIALILGITGGIISGILIKTNLIPSPGPSLLEHTNMPRLQFLFAAVIMAPIVEEAIFRWQLKRFTGGIVFVAFMCGVVISALLKTRWGFLCSIPIFITLFVVYRFTLADSITRKFQFWKSVFPWHFHFTAICFALVHLANFEKGISLLPFGLLYTLPQFLLALLLGYTRMNYGLKYSIVLHSLYNLSFAILLLTKH